MIYLFEDHPDKDLYDSLYKPVRGKVDGLAVRKNIPNIGSIQSTLYNYDILEEVREIPISDFETQSIYELFYAKNDIEHSEELAKEIGESGEISPLIVVIDEETESEGPYILEGVHRFGALLLLKKRALPALVVIEYE